LTNNRTDVPKGGEDSREKKKKTKSMRKGYRHKEGKKFNQLGGREKM